MEKIKGNKFNLLCIFLLMMLVLYIGSGSCERSVAPSDNLKQEIKQQVKKRDSVQKIVVFRERERIKYVNKYVKVRYDSLIPCPEKLALCDTVVITQDTLIRELQTLVKVDSVIINNQGQLIHAHESTISDLTKSVKKEKRKRKLITATVTIISAFLMGIALTR